MRFDYSALPLEEVVDLYRHQTSWRELARIYNCPDHKTLARYVTERYPEMETRNRAEAQRARRVREGTSRRRSAATKPVKKAWWQR